MKAIFSLILTMLDYIKSGINIIHKDNGYSIVDLSRIIRQQLFIFNTLCIERKERIAIIAPNSQAWIFLLITAMAKRFNIYIVSPRESLINMRNIILTHQITHIFTTEELGTQLKESGITQLPFIKSITEIGAIYNKSLVDTNCLYFSQYFDPLDLTDYESHRIEKIKLAPQYQEMDDQKLVDWATQLIDETDLYNIHVFSEGSTSDFPTHHKFSGETFEKIVEKIKILAGRNVRFVNLEIEYAEWVPFAVAFFTNSISSNQTTKKDSTTIYDNNTFLLMWREIVESKLQSPLLNFLANLFPFIMTYIAKKALLSHFGTFNSIIILNGGILPVYIKSLLVKTNLPIYTTFGTLGNGYVSFYNHGKGILTDLQEPLVEKGGFVKILNRERNNHYNTFFIRSSTDSNDLNYLGRNLHVLYERTTILSKILWFKQKAKVIRNYAGRGVDVKLFDRTGSRIYTPVTIILSLIRSIRLFNGAAVVSTPEYPKNLMKVLIEVNQREKELLGLNGKELDKKVNSIISKLNRSLPSELKITAFSLVEEGSFAKTRNGNIKSFLYNK